MRLTDISIRALKIPANGATIFHDDLIPGFGVRVSEGGTKSFVLTHGPRRQRETLGRVGVLSLQEARAQAKRRLAEYTLGKSNPTSMRWNEAVEEYLKEVSTRCRPSTHLSYTYSLGKHFRYGTTKLSELTLQDLRQNLNRLADRPAEHQHAFVALRAFMRWAYRQYYLDRNPLDRMRAPHGYTPRERVLSSEEIGRVWNAAGNDSFGRIVKLLILTGQRVGEISQLTGDMVGEETITIPPWLAKNDRRHIIPLGRMASEVLTPRRANGMLYFLDRTGTKHFNSRSTCKRFLDARCGVSDWWIHDLRRTFASGMASIGVGLPVVERLLNHVSGSFGGVAGVYQRYDFFPEMRDAIQRWEAHLAQLVQIGQSY